MRETLNTSGMEIKLMSCDDEKEVFNIIVEEIKDKKLTYSNIKRIMECVKEYMENNAIIK